MGLEHTERDEGGRRYWNVTVEATGEGHWSSMTLNMMYGSKGDADDVDPERLAADVRRGFDVMTGGEPREIRITRPSDVKALEYFG